MPLGSVTELMAGATGWLKAKIHNARLQKLLRKASTGAPCRSLYISMHITPATSPVVVAMAGMILPAMPRDTCFEASAIR